MFFDGSLGCLISRYPEDQEDLRSVWGLTLDRPPSEPNWKHSSTLGGLREEMRAEWMEEELDCCVKEAGPPPRKPATLSAPLKTASVLICISKQAADNFKVSTLTRPDWGMDLHVCCLPACMSLELSTNVHVYWFLYFIRILLHDFENSRIFRALRKTNQKKKIMIYVFSFRAKNTYF